ncbi:response regulator transcription factor [Planctomycetales bacterium ZRK34]|nr:response regulator transcription factor [Planctomycetales bacterium ZRK34]
MSDEQPIVYIVDDDPTICKALSIVIGSQGYGVETFGRAETFLDQYDPDVLGCLLLDLRLPGMSGLQLLDDERNISHHLPTIILTGHSDITHAVSAMKSGAMDFIQKPYDREQLMGCIRNAVVMAGRRQRKRKSTQSVRRRLETLTPRERELLDELLAGKSNKQIAGQWYVSLRTIENHRAHLMSKMNAKNVADLVRAVSVTLASSDT